MDSTSIDLTLVKDEPSDVMCDPISKATEPGEQIDKSETKAMDQTEKISTEVENAKIVSNTGKTETDNGESMDTQTEETSTVNVNEDASIKDTDIVDKSDVADTVPNDASNKEIGEKTVIDKGQDTGDKMDVIEIHDENSKTDESVKEGNKQDTDTLEIPSENTEASDNGDGDKATEGGHENKVETNAITSDKTTVTTDDTVKDGVNKDTGEDCILMEYRSAGDVVIVKDSGDSSSDDSSDDETETNVTADTQINKAISLDREGLDDREKKVKLNRHGFEDIRTKGELLPEELPPLEELTITVDEDVEMVRVGEIQSIVGVLVVIQSAANLPPLNDDTILFVEGHKVLGQVFEVFGPVKSPWYSIRFNEKDNITSKNLSVGMPVYCAPKETSFTKYVFVDGLKKVKGSDASWEDNNEPPEKYIEYSDDEQERSVKSKKKNKNRRRDVNNDNDDTTAATGQKRNKHNQNSSWPPRDVQSRDDPRHARPHDSGPNNPFQGNRNGNEPRPRFGSGQFNTRPYNPSRNGPADNSRPYNRLPPSFGGPPNFQNRPTFDNGFNPFPAGGGQNNNTNHMPVNGPPFQNSRNYSDGNQYNGSGQSQFNPPNAVPVFNQSAVSVRPVGGVDMSCPPPLQWQQAQPPNIQTPPPSMHPSQQFQQQKQGGQLNMPPGQQFNQGPPPSQSPQLNQPPPLMNTNMNQHNSFQHNGTKANNQPTGNRLNNQQAGNGVNNQQAGNSVNMPMFQNTNNVTNSGTNSQGRPGQPRQYNVHSLNPTSTNSHHDHSRFEQQSQKYDQVQFGGPSIAPYRQHNPAPQSRPFEENYRANNPMTNNTNTRNLDQNTSYDMGQQNNPFSYTGTQTPNLGHRNTEQNVGENTKYPQNNALSALQTYNNPHDTAPFNTNSHSMDTINQQGPKYINENTLYAAKIPNMPPSDSGANMGYTMGSNSGQISQSGGRISGWADKQQKNMQNSALKHNVILDQRYIQNNN